MNTPVPRRQSSQQRDATRGPLSRRGSVGVIASLAALAAIVGCGGSTPAPRTATASSTAASHQYTSVHFKVPLTISTDGMKAPPTQDSSNFISWNAIVPGGSRSDGGQYNAVRLLVPTKVYRPNSDLAIKPPKRYLQFLLAQKAYGAHFSDVTKLTIDGRPTTVMTATTRVGLDGTIGCPDIAADQAEGCFGFQPDLALRIAVINVDGTPVVAWARTNAKAPDHTLFANFAAMLKSIRFR